MFSVQCKVFSVYCSMQSVLSVQWCSVLEFSVPCIVKCLMFVRILFSYCSMQSVLSVQSCSVLEFSVPCIVKCLMFVRILFSF